MKEIDICDVQAPTPARTRVTTAQLAREERLVMQVLLETLPSLTNLVASEPTIALLAESPKLDTWRLSLVPRRQMTISGAKNGGALAEEAQTVWKDVTAVQSRLRSAIRFVRMAEAANDPLSDERNPLVRRLVSREAKEWLFRAESRQFLLRFPDFRELEDRSDLVVTGQISAITLHTVTLELIAIESSELENPLAKIAQRKLTLSRPATDSMRRIGEYFDAPPQCGDVVSVRVRLHRGRLTGAVCGATLRNCAPAPSIATTETVD